jgi:hypothetical protein
VALPVTGCLDTSVDSSHSLPQFLPLMLSENTQELSISAILSKIQFRSLNGGCS